MKNKLIVKLLSLYGSSTSYIFRPILGTGCRYSPSCSLYAKESFEKYTFFKALGKSIKRVMSCHPLAKGGYDPVI